MATLTEEQISFLERHEIPLTWMFDAEGLTRPEYKRAMKNEEKYFAYGVKECLNGHTLRTRHGII
jgi:hypothetical protein